MEGNQRNYLLSQITLAAIDGSNAVSENTVFLEENVRYPVWTCRDPISLILGAWW